jgi:hypothetical protein
VHDEFPNAAKIEGLRILGTITGMRDFLFLLVHLVVVVLRLAKPGGLRKVVAESVLVLD